MKTTISPTSHLGPIQAENVERRSILSLVADDGRGPDPAFFSGSRERFEKVVSWLKSGEASKITHGELEAHLEVEAREVFRQLVQDHLDLRAHRETRLEEVIGADGVARTRVEAGHDRGLQTVFGEVEVKRMGYRRRRQANLYPADAGLNLPVEHHSHGLRRLAALESTRGSFEDAQKAVEQATGQRLGKRQLEQLVGRSAVDFDDFYREQARPTADEGDVLVLSCDGKGVVMRHDSLRPATAEAAERADTDQTRLSKGERRNRKRMAEVGAVYDLTPQPRTPDDILPDTDHQRVQLSPARNKWLIASVVEDAASVVSNIFDEAQRRDPEHRRPWVALVDGNNHQLDRIRAEAKARGVGVTIVCDFIHVLEYLWKAARCFYSQDDPRSERWVRQHARKILAGHSGQVAAAIRRKATYLRLSRLSRENADTCSDYLLRKQPFLNYPHALQQGWPIATGIIEGACRHLVKDRMDITGARWGLQGAEAVLKLRALVTNGDFAAYWQYHLSMEQRRVHHARYAPTTSLQKAA